MLDFVLQTAARFGTDINLSCAIASSAGLLSHHLYFIRGYRTGETRNIIAGHCIALGLLLYKTTSSPSGILQGLPAYLAVSSAYFGTLFTSIAIYRVFFHPLRHFPGPFALKVTQLYMPWLGRKGQLHREYLTLHEEYGEFLRVGPNAVSIVNADALTVIHGPRSSCSKKDTGMYDSIHYKGEPNIDTITDKRQHRDRRVIWDKALSAEALRRYEPATRVVMRDWLDRLDQISERPIDTTHYAKLIGFDNMGRIGFSLDFGTVREGREDRMLELLEITFGHAAAAGQVYWPQALIMSMPKFGMQKEFEQLAVDIAHQRIKNDSADKDDMLKYFLADLNAEKSRAIWNMNTLISDTQGILVAATDTVACVLSLIFYYLARDADLRQQLYDEIAPLYGKTEPGEFTISDLNTVTIFDGILDEVMRLHAPVPIGGPRSTPPEGIHVAGRFLPGGVIVYTPSQAYHMSDKYFVQPDEFIPERWTTRPELVINKKAFFPFHMGRFNCVGRHLARNVIRMTVAYTLYDYDFTFAPGEDGRRFRTEEEWKLIVKQASLDCVFTKRGRA